MKNFLARTPHEQEHVQYYSQKQHKISSKQIDKTALDAVRQLKKKGYKAYIVGGCLRDLMLHQQPKDFDVATDAHPLQIKKTIPRSIIIGRRFQLVHVRKGQRVIEISTFRAPGKNLLKRLLLRINPSYKKRITENTFGSMQDDAYRRDITINAMYYDPESARIIDYVGAMEDISRKTASVIGDSKVRFIEDPMRMIRVLRFAAKLNLKLADSIPPAIAELHPHIKEIPDARMFDEFLKLFFSGHAHASYMQLEKHDLMQYFLAYVPQKGSAAREKIIPQALKNADLRIKKGTYFTPLFLICVLLWFFYQEALGSTQPKKSSKNRRRKKRVSYHQKHTQACEKVFSAQREVMHIPMRYRSRIEKIWLLLHNLSRYEQVAPKKLFENKNFRITYDFLKLLAPGYPEMKETCAWWDNYMKENKMPETAPANFSKDALRA